MLLQKKAYSVNKKADGGIFRKAFTHCLLLLFTNKKRFFNSVSIAVKY